MEDERAPALDVRDTFAQAALIGLVTGSITRGTGITDAEYIAKQAYAIADAMIQVKKSGDLPIPVA